MGFPELALSTNIICWCNDYTQHNNGQFSIIIYESLLRHVIQAVAEPEHVPTSWLAAWRPASNIWQALATGFKGKIVNSSL